VTAAALKHCNISYITIVKGDTNSSVNSRMQVAPAVLRIFFSHNNIKKRIYREYTLFFVTSNDPTNFWLFIFGDSLQFVTSHQGEEIVKSTLLRKVC
jgi:hypothetical protein